MATLGSIPSNATLTSADVSDFTEAVQDTLNTTLVAGSNVTLTYNDAANTLTIASAGGGGGGGFIDTIADTNTVDLTVAGTTLSATIPTTATPTIRSVTFGPATITSRIIEDTTHDGAGDWTGGPQGTRVEIRHGGTGEPLDGTAPSVRLVTLTEYTGGTGRNGVDYAGLVVKTRGLAGSKSAMQAGSFYSQSLSTVAPGGSGFEPDAQAVSGIGELATGAKGRGIGGFFYGRINSDANTAGSATGSEAMTVNSIVGNDHSVNTAGAGAGSQTMGVWIVAGGVSRSAAAVQVGAVTGVKFQVGFYVGNRSGSTIIEESTFRDAGAATTSLDVQGSHVHGLKLSGTFTTAALAIASGKFIVGGTSTAVATDGLMKSTSDTQRALVVQANSATTSVNVFEVRKSDNTVTFSAAVSEVRVAIGLVMADVNMILGTTTGTKFGTSTSQKLGFYNATPIVQPSGIGAAATDAATTQTLANNLRTALINLGLVAV